MKIMDLKDDGRVFCILINTLEQFTSKHGSSLDFKGKTIQIDGSFDDNYEFSVGDFDKSGFGKLLVQDVITGVSSTFGDVVIIYLAGHYRKKQSI